MRKFQLLACMPESTFGFKSARGGQLTAAIIRFSLFYPLSHTKEALIAAAADNLLSEAYDEAVLEPAGRLAERCRSIAALSRQDDKLARWRAQLETAELLYELIAAVRTEKKGSTLRALERVKSWMEERYMEDMSIERLAGMAELSPKYFADLFKKTYGISALDKVLELRMAKAKQLMLRNDRRLRDIAHEVGYEDEFYFSRKFKQVYHVSPSHYIKQRMRKIAAYGCAASIGYLIPLNIVPYAAPMHPKWAGHYYEQLHADVPYQLDAYRNNCQCERNYNLLAEAKPEMIVCTPNVEARETSRLAEIANTLVLPQDAAFSWKSGLRAVAAALGEQAEAERWIADYERRTPLLQKRIAEAIGSESVLVVRMLGDAMYSYTNQGIEDVMYAELSIRRAGGFPTADTYGGRLTLAQLEAINADHVLLLVCQESETLSFWHALRQSPEWLALSFVHDGRLQLIPSHPWREYSPSSVQRLRDDIISIFCTDCPS